MWWNKHFKFIYLLSKKKMYFWYNLGTIITHSSQSIIKTWGKIEGKYTFLLRLIVMVDFINWLLEEWRILLKDWKQRKTVLITCDHPEDRVNIIHMLTFLVQDFSDWVPTRRRSWTFCSRIKFEGYINQVKSEEDQVKKSKQEG